MEDILRGLEDRGFRATAVPIERLDDLRVAYDALREKGVLDPRFSDQMLGGLAFAPPADLPDARSLIVAAAADPVVMCTFRWRGGVLPLPVPPTYLHGIRKDEDLAIAVLASLPRGARVRRLNAPKKLLAVCSGLAQFGRNNIAYVEGMGSFHRLSVLASDVACAGGEWTTPSLMPQCDGCSLCIAACPTGAIREDRFLLSAERCITYWNEQEDVEFPNWMHTAWHNSVVGCLRCQEACPENRNVVGLRLRGPDFTEEEAEVLLDSGRLQDLPGPLEAKLAEWDMLPAVGVLPRNLGVHLRPGGGMEGTA